MNAEEVRELIGMIKDVVETEQERPEAQFTAEEALGDIEMAIKEKRAILMAVQESDNKTHIVTYGQGKELADLIAKQLVSISEGESTIDLMSFISEIVSKVLTARGENLDGVLEGLIGSFLKKEEPVKDTSVEKPKPAPEVENVNLDEIIAELKRTIGGSGIDTINVSGSTDDGHVFGVLSGAPENLAKAMAHTILRTSQSLLKYTDATDVKEVIDDIFVKTMELLETQEEVA